MASFFIWLLVLLSILVLLLAIFAAVSYFKDDVRAHLSGIRSRSTQPTTFGRQYGRMMSHGGNQGGWEHIEMEDMLDKRDAHFE